MSKLELLFVILFLLFPIKGGYPEGVITLSKAGLDKIKEAEIIRINQQDLKMVQLPTKNSPKVMSNNMNYFNTTFQQTKIHLSQVELSLIRISQVIQIHITNISGSSKGYIEYELSSAKGLCSANLSFKEAIGNFFLTISKDYNGRPIFKANGAASMELNQIKVSSDKCDDIGNQTYVQSLYQSIFYNIYFDDYIQSILREEVDSINQYFGQIHQDYNIYQSVYQHYSLLEAPLIQNDYITFDVDSYSYYKNQTILNKDIKSNELPQFDTNSTKDVQFFLSESFFQNIIDTNYQAGIFKYNYTIPFIGNLFNFTCFAVRSPSITIMNNINLNESIMCNISYQTSFRTFNFSISFDALYELNLTLINSTIYFIFNNQTSRIVNLNLSLIPNQCIWLKNLIRLPIIPCTSCVIKQLLEQNGIPLPPIIQIPNSTLEKFYENNYVAIYFNL